MSDPGRKKILAVVLALFAIFVVWRQFGGGGSDVSGRAGVLASRANARGQRAATQTPGTARVIPLEIDRLEHRAAEYSPGRDLFQYHRPAPAALAKPENFEPPKPKIERSRPAEPATPRKPTPPPIDFEFLGSFGPDGRRIAVFTDKKGILNALEGDILNDKFIVGPIGYESVEVGFVGFPDVAPKRIAAGG